MKKMTAEELRFAFEVLADDKHHSSVFRASERIRQHLVAVEAEAAHARAACDGYARDFGQTPESQSAREALRAANVALAQARESALEEVLAESSRLKGEIAQRVEECIRALKSRPEHATTPVELASEENGLLPKSKTKRQPRMPPCGHARCEMLPSGEEAHVATCPNFGTR